MTKLYLQCHAGISGDMFLGALLDAGLDETQLREMLKTVNVSEEEVHIAKTKKKGITSTSLHVEPRENRHHLHVEDIRKVIAQSGLKQPVVDKALEAFERIVKAEAEVHGVPYEKVHLHEVSGLDTIVDILGVAWGLDALGVEETVSTPINVGSGTVTFSHGVVPVPAPATALILRGIPIIDDGLPGERTTPTGAALAATFIDSFDPPGVLIPLQIGYGAGNRDDGDRANVLRVMLCKDDKKKDDSVEYESLTMIETDIDDDTPEVLGYLMERLAGFAGVLDASIIGTLRKKGRPGYLVRVLCISSESPSVREFIFSETGTIGIREIRADRFSLPRRIKTVDTEWGPVRVKFAGDTIAPEFEDCRMHAKTTGVPLKTVYAAALAGAYDAMMNKTTRRKPAGI